MGDLCQQLVWEPVDTGPLSMSLHLEHMTWLWIGMARVQDETFNPMVGLGGI